MQKCSPRERALVYAVVELGMNQTQAGLAAGYGANSETTKQAKAAAAVGATTALGRHHVQEAVKEEVVKRAVTSTPLAMGVLIDIAKNPTVSPAVRERCAGQILDRGGLVVRQKLDVTTTDETAEGVRREIAAFAKELGLAPERLLGYKPANVVDAEFEEVKPWPTEDGPLIGVPPELEGVI